MMLRLDGCTSPDSVMDHNLWMLLSLKHEWNDDLYVLFQNDEVSLQRKVRTEVIQLEDTLAQVRKEYEMLRIEFEQTLAANEQAGNIPLLSLQ